MKAVILAGGEGSRLRPLTLGRPKPMTPLLGKPVLGHILDLLRRHGVREIAVTLRYLPAAVTDYFGDGSDCGVKLTYFVEDEPLGTAGGVKKCMGFLGEEDFLVVSGDAVCDLDLSALAALHQSRRSAASLALCRRAKLRWSTAWSGWTTPAGCWVLWKSPVEPGGHGAGQHRHLYPHPPGHGPGAAKESRTTSARSSFPRLLAGGRPSTAGRCRATGRTWGTAGPIWESRRRPP